MTDISFYVQVFEERAGEIVLGKRIAAASNSDAYQAAEALVPTALGAAAICVRRDAITSSTIATDLLAIFGQAPDGYREQPFAR